MSIVLELQRDSLNPAVAVSDLLRKALLIATKLDIPDFKAWIENELSGYIDSNSAVPPYRISTGNVMGQDEWGRWLPVIFADPESAKTLSRVIFSDSIAGIEALIHRTNRDKGGNLTIDFSPEQQEILRRSFSNGAVRHTRAIRVEDLKGIVDAVRTEILRWSMKLEKDGILGEGMTFSTDEQRKASAVHYTTHFHAPVGNVAQNSQHVSQTASIVIQPQALAKLVTDFSSHIDELSLDIRQKQRVEAQLAILNAELNGEPDPEIVKQAGRTLRNITEGAIGSLVATAIQPSVWHWIQQMLASF
jgi:hypothetical protein